MEQKKTLWIVAASGVFLLVVVGAALLLSLQKNGSSQNNFNPSDGWISSAKAPDVTFTPGIPPQGQAANPPADYSFECVSPVEEARAEIKPAQPETNAPIKANNVTVIADNTLVYGSSTTTTIDLNALKSNPAASAAVTPKNSYTAEQMNTGTAENVQPSVNENSKTVSAVSQNSKKTEEKYYSPAPVAKQTTPKKEAVKPAVSSAKSTAKKTVKPAAAAAQTKPSSFWIQVGSYEAKKSADEARTILENNKIQNEVFTYTDAKGTLFYRVRVGPYTTKSEAEYWKNKISELREFEKVQSYVVQN